MERQAVEELNADLAEFTDDVFAYLAYAGQRGYGRQYLRGLMLDGRRKSVEPMAERLVFTLRGEGQPPDEQLRRTLCDQ
ncbi:transposase [Streptomyces mirabilis]|uniref:transposase n=1 Tax=Streptomyces mirabilis TaxID=68239 RepID=UPI000BCD24F0|nr:DDE superfamily endonuclease [Streptomyces sp. OK228]